MTTTRRSALALAGAVAGTLTAASLAGAVNLGLLSSDPGPSSDPTPFIEADAIEPASTSTSTTVLDGVEIVIEDVYDLPASETTPSTGAATAPAALPPAPSQRDAGPTTTRGATASGTADHGAVRSDDHGEDDEYEHENEDDEHEHDDHEDDEHEHEGSDDDD